MANKALCDIAVGLPAIRSSSSSSSSSQKENQQAALQKSDQTQVALSPSNDVAARSTEGQADRGGQAGRGVLALHHYVRARPLNPQLAWASQSLVEDKHRVLKVGGAYCLTDLGYLWGWGMAYAGWLCMCRIHVVCQNLTVCSELHRPVN